MKYEKELRQVVSQLKIAAEDMGKALQQVREGNQNEKTVYNAGIDGIEQAAVSMRGIAKKAGWNG